MIGNPKTFQAVTAIRQSKSNYNCKPSIDESDTILGIEIDNKLNFEKHIKSLCRKASQKLGAIQRISNLLETQNKNLLFNTVIKF